MVGRCAVARVRADVRMWWSAWTRTADDPAARYGDEPWLIAQRAGVPVFVGRERAAAGRLAESTLVDAGGAGHVHLLDDGMQHRGLARDVEIVLLHRSDFETTLLPAGRLREPLAALARADFVVLREEDAALAERARRWMRTDAQIWMIRRELELPQVAGSGGGLLRDRASGGVCRRSASEGCRDCGDACVARSSSIYRRRCRDACATLPRIVEQNRF